MHKKFIRYGSRLLAVLLLCLTVLTAASCATWDWLWSRDMGESVDSDNMILGDGVPEGDTDVIWEGSVEYTGEAHSGTDIYYVGKKGSPNRSRIIVIDPGHQLKGSAALEPNGPNSEVMKAEVTWGATGVYTGQTEYELNLAVALLLRDELIRRGYSVVMIRETNNVSISNMKRAEIANKYEAAAYIRIHANSWTDSTMRGAMTICQSASNPYPTCAAHYLRSHRLSQLVLNEFCDQTGISKLNMREMDDMTGTNWSEVPTTILEMGFLSNKSDDTLMATDYFRQEAAIGVANGLDAYFEWLETQLPEWQTQPATEAPTRVPAEDSAEEPTEAPTDTIGDVTTDTPTDTADVTEGPTVEATDPAETADTAPEDDGLGETTESEEPEEPEETEADVPADTAENAPAEPPAEAA